MANPIAVDGEGAARYIKSTNSNNTNTPIIAISAYGSVGALEASNLFAASLAKPLQKADLLAVMRQLGFKTSAIQGPEVTKAATARRVVS
jgi:serine/threonine-protein kinase RIM15